MDRALPTKGLMLALSLAISGCTYTVRMLSAPEGATAMLPDGRVVTLPTVQQFQRGKRQLIRIDADGHRSLVVDMNRTEGRALRYTGAALFQKGGREVTYVLVPDKPPVGDAATDTP